MPHVQTMQRSNKVNCIRPIKFFKKLNLNYLQLSLSAMKTHEIVRHTWLIFRNETIEQRKPALAVHSKHTIDIRISRAPCCRPKFKTPLLIHKPVSSSPRSASSFFKIFPKSQKLPRSALHNSNFKTHAKSKTSPLLFPPTSAFRQSESHAWRHRNKGDLTSGCSRLGERKGSSLARPARPEPVKPLARRQRSTPPNVIRPSANSIRELARRWSRRHGTPLQLAWLRQPRQRPKKPRRTNSGVPGLPWSPEMSGEIRPQSISNSQSENRIQVARKRSKWASSESSAHWIKRWWHTLSV